MLVSTLYRYLVSIPAQLSKKWAVILQHSEDVRPKVTSFEPLSHTRHEIIVAVQKGTRKTATCMQQKILKIVHVQ